jgi:hypothetical protein
LDKPFGSLLDLQFKRRLQSFKKFHRKGEEGAQREEERRGKKFLIEREGGQADYDGMRGLRRGREGRRKGGGTPILPDGTHSPLRLLKMPFTTPAIDTIGICRA